MKKIIRVLFITLVSIYNLQAQDVIEYKFRVEGNCGMCKEKIEQIAIKKGKAQSANWNQNTKILVVEIDETVTSDYTIKWELAQGGYDNGNYIAPDEVYDALHFCCKYRVPHNEQGQNQDLAVEQNEVKDASKDLSTDLSEVTGYIFAYVEGKKEPLIGATVTIEGQLHGTTSDASGYFELRNVEAAKSLTVSYIGYQDQVIKLEEGELEIIMADGVELEVVEVVFKKKTTEISTLSTINSEQITREELCKAACCNLSESFETNPSVDISFNDAVTGTKQIQMLGLAGPYVQITRELIPDVRTMNNIYGLNMTAGPWIESIQLIKGTGSVVNGFESIAGQINVELKKPEKGELLHVNGYVNNGGRLELNTNVRRELTKSISTGVLFHGKKMPHAHDNNGDGFTDMPMENDFVVANRWKFKGEGPLEGQLGIKYANLNHEGGYHDHFTGASQDHENHWRMKVKTRRWDLWSKTGYIFPSNPEMSIGLQMSAVFNEQDGAYGFEDFDFTERNLFGNLIFQNIFDNGHIIRTGLSYQNDDIEELVQKSGFYIRNESVPGAYLEYTFLNKDKWSIIPGLRYDHHNIYGGFITPRVHAKYNFTENSIVRLTAGRGQRTANIFAENLGLFASARSIQILNQANDLPYGLEAEVAFNYGVNFTHAMKIAERDLVAAVDFYRTEFENQIIIDYETAGKAFIYNLNGQSFAYSYQIKFDYELVNNLDVRLAYRYFDVQATYQEGLISKPFISRHRAFINAAYKTTSDWHFDATLNWRGSKRLPSTASNPIAYQRPDNSPSYFILNGQISKRFGDKWDIYLGGENLLNYKQTDAIIAGDDAFGEFFDASIVWAPLFGSNIYLGFRYNLVK